MSSSRVHTRRTHFDYRDTNACVQLGHPRVYNIELTTVFGDATCPLCIKWYHARQARLDRRGREGGGGIDIIHPLI